jgi:Na+/H+-dicarboxylate symporter
LLFKRQVRYREWKWYRHFLESPDGPWPRSQHRHRCQALPPTDRVEAAERRLQLPEQVTGFVLPLAVSTFKIAAPVSWPIGALFVGWFYGIPLHAGQLAIVAVASIFLAAAAPSVPRGAFLMLAPLFLAIGLPVKEIGLLIALDAIPDLFATVLNTTGDLAATAIVARPSTVEMITPPRQTPSSRVAVTPGESLREDLR